ncbi:type II toxin-antitoxin system death-on-curing family toxin [Endozoicomonas numazuensis]|uniref:Death-on-curing protein n=1 Tax=Endozoicomonas numazuensis TaxID=1137799 RepID=A0A081NJB0_9GAMM|nr:Fic family protein [Endozoicomonas numazuensis]KEQ18533.1 death-on-curing protein [Endozoicomonas numazuensis]
MYENNDDLPLFYFDVAHAVKEHDWIIEHSGGRAGIKDQGILESVLEHIQNDQYYPTLEAKLTHLVFGVNKFHAFVDGNKRSSIALGAYFLEMNGLGFCVHKFIHTMENYAVWLAEDLIDKELLGDIITSLIEDDDFPEALKLRIARAASQSISR